MIQDDGETARLQLAGVVRWCLDLKLSNGSSGCVQFILDNKMATQLQQPRGRQRLIENRSEFLDILQRARSSVKPSLGYVDSTVSAYGLSGGQDARGLAGRHQEQHGHHPRPGLLAGND